MGLSEVADGIVVGMMAGGENPEGDVVIGRFFYLPRRGNAHAVGVEKKLYHHGRMISRLTLESSAVRLFYFGDVKLIHHIRDEVDEVRFGQPLTQ